MRRWLLAVACLLWAGPALAQTQIGPANMIICNKIAQFSGVSAITQIVALVASGSPGGVGNAIYICGWHITNTAASGTFNFSYGTGSNCGTGNVALTPALNVTSSAPSADHVDYATMVAPNGTALCVTPSATTLSGVVFYSQY
jgi:hypothetical protein